MLTELRYIGQALAYFTSNREPQKYESFKPRTVLGAASGLAALFHAGNTEKDVFGN